jgi:hypothetical protein
MSDLQQAHVIGWTIFAAAVGLILVDLGNEIAKLPSWSTAVTPAFIGSALAHLGAVVGGFVGGKIIPTNAEQR